MKMITMYWLLNVYYELMRQYINQNTVNLRKLKIQLLSLQEKLEIIPRSNKFSGIVLGFTKYSDTRRKLLGIAILFDSLALSEKHPTEFY